jgi:hypothetical protein
MSEQCMHQGRSQSLALLLVSSSWQQLEARTELAAAAAVAGWWCGTVASTMLASLVVVLPPLALLLLLLQWRWWWLLGGLYWRLCPASTAAMVIRTALCACPAVIRHVPEALAPPALRVGAVGGLVPKQRAVLAQRLPACAAMPLATLLAGTAAGAICVAMHAAGAAQWDFAG